MGELKLAKSCPWDSYNTVGTLVDADAFIFYMLAFGLIAGDRKKVD